MQLTLFMWTWLLFCKVPFLGDQRMSIILFLPSQNVTSYLNRNFSPTRLYTRYRTITCCSCYIFTSAFLSCCTCNKLPIINLYIRWKALYVQQLVKLWGKSKRVAGYVMTCFYSCTSLILPQHSSRGFAKFETDHISPALN